VAPPESDLVGGYQKTLKVTGSTLKEELTKLFLLGVGVA
jgi:hypothetical protein